MSKSKDVIKTLSNKTKILVVLGVLAIVVVIVLLMISNQEKDTERITTISESSLKEVLEISELSTVDYTYNAIATKYKEEKQKDDKKKTDAEETKPEALYHVAYEGTVTAGIDFDKITIEVLEDEKKIIITVPEIEIHNTDVNIGTMDYIFVDKDSETETVSADAYKLCKEDLAQRVETENVLYETAKENAISTVEALFKPWIEMMDDTYVVEIR